MLVETVGKLMPSVAASPKVRELLDRPTGAPRNGVVVFAAMSAIGGIGLVAMPTGIMAAAFSEAVQKHSRDLVNAKGVDSPPAAFDRSGEFQTDP